MQRERFPVVEHSADDSITASIRQIARRTTEKADHTEVESSIIVGVTSSIISIDLSADQKRAEALIDRQIYYSISIRKHHCELQSRREKGSIGNESRSGSHGSEEPAATCSTSGQIEN